ncbi:MAG: hypothetical protein JWQ71_1399 [Pedosphaera sp.]|nr:hypothetical protein [Pedosphaera sp.]
MKLHAPDGILLVTDAHDFAFVSLGGDFEAIGDGVALDDEGVITGRGKRVRHVLEEIFAVVLNGRRFAVHHAIVHDDFSAESMTDALMAEADAEEWQLGAEGADDLVGQAGFARGTGAGRDENTLGFEVVDLIEGNLVVAMDL